MDQVLYIQPAVHRELKEICGWKNMTYLRDLLITNPHFNRAFLHFFGEGVRKCVLQREKTLVVISHRRRGYSLRRFCCPGFVL